MLKSLTSKLIKGLRKLIQSDKFRESLIVTTIALLLSPFSIYFGFQINAYLSKPLLSVEYVSRYEKKYFNFDKVIPFVKGVTNNDIYQEYRSKMWTSVNYFDLRMIKNIPSLARPSDLANKIKDEIEHYDGYLAGEVEEAEAKIKKLPNISKIDMRILSHQFLDSSSATKDDELRIKLGNYFKKRKAKINSIKGTLKELAKILGNLDKVIDIKLSILNKGSTDGLIRNRGTIYYGRSKYRIQRISPPSSQNTINAVPTFQVNLPTGTYSPQSVGQIIKNTMTELWFRVEEQKTGNTDGLCSKQGQFTLILYDQDSKSVERKFNCIEDK
ncbi:MAG: hypothetical protein COB30_004045 [Ectothiorhodospiraceae bacterium]|nr:hypothetical protein [Ectothiorhodospiraceae bacterium]